MSKKIQPGDLVAFPQQYIDGVVASVFLYVVDEKLRRSAGVQYYHITRLYGSKAWYQPAAGRIAHVCANCLRLKKDHMPGGHCLYGPGTFAVLTLKKYREYNT